MGKLNNNKKMAKVDGEKLCESVLGVLLPPVLMYMEKKCSSEFWISLILYLFLVTAILSIIYTFHTLDYKDLCHNVLCVLLPPVAVYLNYKFKQEFWITLILTLLIWVPGIIY